MSMSAKKFLYVRVYLSYTSLCKVLHGVKIRRGLAGSSKFQTDVVENESPFKESDLRIQQ